VTGDIDCDVDVDAVDALFVIRLADGLPNGGGGCGQSPDVDCSGSSDRADGVVVLRHVVGLPLGLSSACAVIGMPAQAPLIGDLHCADAKAAGEAVACSATISGVVTYQWWTAPDGSPGEGVGQASSSVACAPDGGPCLYSGTIAGFTTAFPLPGEKSVALTVCNGPFCAGKAVTVVVSPP
jgi:hypothetical protein